MNNESSLVVLAAGMGRRFAGPKQLAPVGPSGETILDFSIHDALGAGFGKVVLVVQRKMRTAFEASIVTRWRPRANVELVYQEVSSLPGGIVARRNRTKPWGTAHAVLAAAEVVSGKLAVVNADDFYGAAAFTELAAFLREPVDFAVPVYALVGFPLWDTLSTAGSVNRALLVVDENDWLQEIEEAIGIEGFGGNGRYRAPEGDIRVIPGDALISRNMWGFTPDVFSQIDEQFRTFLATHSDDSGAEFLLPSAIGSVVRDGRAKVKVISATGRSYGLTHPGDTSLVATMLKDMIDRGMYPRDLWS